MPEYYDAQADAVLAVWSAIDNHADTKDLFNRKFRFTGESPLVNRLAPAFGDLDALWIMPADSVIESTVNTQDTDNLRLALVMYTKDWNILTPLRNVFKIKRAIMREKPDGGVPYCSPYAPRIHNQQIKYEPIVIDETNPIQAIKTTILLVLRIPFVH